MRRRNEITRFSLKLGSLAAEFFIGNINSIEICGNFRTVGFKPLYMILSLASLLKQSIAITMLQVFPTG